MKGWEWIANLSATVEQIEMVRSRKDENMYVKRL